MDIWKRATRSFASDSSESRSKNDRESSGKSYRYKLLKHEDETRVLTIFPGQPSDPLRIELKHVRFSDSPRYAALSYVCGDRDGPRHTIQVGKNVASILTNLHTALRALRTPDTTMTVWADALSINQTDIPEKNMQVKSMTVLYPNATLVVCWLGEDDGTAATAFALMEQWAKARHPDQKQLKQQLVEKARRQVMDKTDGERNALRSLFGRDYFRRAWTLQETCVDPAHPPLLLCGRQQMSFGTLWFAFFEISRSLPGYESATLLGDSVEFIQPMFRLYGFGEARFQFSALVPSVVKRESWDPRDRIFAFYGLFSRHGKMYPDPDYDMPVEKVFMMYTRASMQIEGNLDILLAVDTFDDGKSSMPSWSVKPWKMAHDYSAVEQLNFTPEQSLHLFCATGNSTPGMAPSHCLDDPVLCLTGSHMDEIAVVSPVDDLVAQLQQSPRSWKQAMDTCQKFCESLELQPTYRLHEREASILEAFATCVTGETFFLSHQTENSGPGYVERERFYAAYIQQLAEQAGADTSESPLSQDELLRWAHSHFAYTTSPPQAADSARASNMPVKFLDWTAASMIATQVVKVLRQRVLIRTRSGHLGFAHERSRPGDSVCLLVGSTVPFVLRKTENMQNRWRLISDAYVCGIMHGEAYHESGDGTLEYCIV